MTSQSFRHWWNKDLILIISSSVFCVVCLFALSSVLLKDRGAGRKHSEGEDAGEIAVL